MNQANGQLNNWAKFLRAKGVGEKHVRQFYGYASTLIGLSGINGTDEITPARVMDAVTILRTAGLGMETANRYITATKSYAQFLRDEGLLVGDPLRRLPRFNVRLDRRHQRRVLTEVEARTLIADVMGAGFKVRHQMTPMERANLYRVALYTGLRANECRLLTRGMFDFGTGLLTLPASITKNKKDAVLLMHPDLIAHLLPFCGNYSSAAQLFTPPAGVHLGRILREDLESAGIPYCTTAGYADFHSLRHTFCSRLGAANVPLQTLQAMARHSDARMTMKYLHSDRDQERKALAALPATN